MRLRKPEQSEAKFFTLRQEDAMHPRPAPGFHGFLLPFTSQRGKVSYFWQRKHSGIFTKAFILCGRDPESFQLPTKKTLSIFSQFCWEVGDSMHFVQDENYHDGVYN